MGEEDENEVIWTGVLMRFLTAVLSSISAVSLMFITDGNDTLILKIAMLESISILASAFDTFMYWFQAKLLSKYVSIASVLAYLGMSLYRAYLLINGSDILWFAFATSVDTLLLSLVLMVCYIRKNGFHPKVSMRLGKRLFKQSYHYMISGMIAILYSKIDQIMLKQMLDERAVGLYAGALQIATLWSMIPSAFIQSVSPVLYKNAEENREMFLKRLKQSYAGIWFMNICWSLFITIFSKWAVRLILGEKYIGAESALIIVVWYTGISSIGSLTQVYLATENKNKYVNYFALGGLVTDVILNFLLIPQFGMEGAAVATLCTYIVISIVMPLMIKDTREAGKMIIQGMCFKGVVDDTLKRTVKQYAGKIFGKIKRE